MSKKKVIIRLNGDVTQKYNFGTNGEQEWKDGGTDLEVSAEEAKDLVEVKRIAHYLDPENQSKVVATQQQVSPTTDMKFDQDETATK